VHLEGKQSVLAALRARKRKIQLVLIKAGSQEERIHEILKECEKQTISVKYVSASELDHLAFGKTHGGIVALCSRRHPDKFEDLQTILHVSSSRPLLLVLEGVEDANHLGYLLRSAEALGAQAVLLKKHVWDFDEIRVSRASSGAFERLPLIKLSDASQVRKFHKFDIRLWGCIANAKRTVYDVDLTAPVALAVGGEKRGLSGKLRDECDGFLRIPMMQGSASSLSLTHAACLLLGEVFRQRQMPSPL